MRLVKLTVSAVGPFADEVTIDFARLGAAGIFLLEGPTGSGKSTIIDAITFALYGTTAGNSSLDRLQSQASPPGSVPTVDLVFDVPEGRFQVVRSPAHERPKRRGAGTTTSPASAKLWRSHPPQTEPTLITGRAKEVDTEVLRLIGLTHEQFVQTVVLPQGEFSRFLCAKPGDRAEVLKRLFATETYDAIADELHRRKQAAWREWEGAAKAVRDRASAFAAIARLGDDHAAAIFDAPSEYLFGLITESCAEISDQVSAAERELVAVKASLSASELALEEARRIERAWLRHAQATDQLRELDERKSEYDHWVRDADLLAKVDSAAPLYRRLLTVRGELNEARRAWRLIASSADVPEEIAPNALTESLTCQLTLCAALTEHARVERELGVARQRLAADRLTAQALVTRRDEHRTALESAREVRSELEERRQALDSRATDQEQLAKESNRAAERVDAAIRLEQLRAELDLERNKVKEASRAAEAATRHLADLHSAYRNNLAGQLAAELTTGEPCPVCGSAEHPHPAPAPEITVTAKELDAAETRSSAAHDALRRAAAELQRTDGEVNRAAIACGDVTAAVAREDLTNWRTKLDQAVRDADELAQVRESLIEVDTRIVDHEELLAVVDREQAAIQERIRIAEESLADTEAALTPHRQSWATIDERLAHVESHCRALETARETLTQRERAESSLIQRQADLQVVLDQAGLSSEETVADFIGRVGERAELRGRIRDYEDRAATARATLAEPEVAEASAGDRPDVAMAEDRTRRARDLHESALVIHRRWRERLVSAEAAANGARRAVAVLDRVERRTREIVRLAEIVAGNSPANLADMPLATYVLVDRFRAVVESANERLQKMSDGRYLLEHHGEREDRARRTGLGLRIRDLQTDSIRDPRTLSGGETFYASLSLALGLADVVTAEAGGRSLDTLFIDEGFGGLDPETLDQVMGEIENLRSGNRVVGLVSHVRELKERVPNRIEVRRLGSGRSALVVRA
ncbi:MAG: SMC family ATPase [Candidatus Nanopelagicales bacterium]|nr:SMC family ATPase [Candidatus Nanopelagicales bacterium]